MSSTPRNPLFKKAEERFITWYKCTTTLRSATIASFLNAHYETNFTELDVRAFLTKIRNYSGRTRIKYETPRGRWKCPEYFGFSCVIHQRPRWREQKTRLFFQGTEEDFFCCNHTVYREDEAPASSSDEFDSLVRPELRLLEWPEQPDHPKQAKRAKQRPDETEGGARRLPTFLSQFATSIKRVYIIYFLSSLVVMFCGYSTARSLALPWEDILAVITDIKGIYYNFVRSAGTLKRAKFWDSSLLLIVQLLTFAGAMHQSIRVLRMFSPPAIQTLESPNLPPRTSTLNTAWTPRWWFSLRFPYLVHQVPDPEHEIFTISNLLWLITCIAIDIFNGTVFSVSFYGGLLLVGPTCLSTLGDTYWIKQPTLLSTMQDRGTAVDSVLTFFEKVDCWYSDCFTPSPSFAFLTTGVLMYAFVKNTKYLGIILWFAFTVSCTLLREFWPHFRDIMWYILRIIGQILAYGLSA